MLIFFSICSVIYALFYAAIIFLHKNINYVENIFSLNFDKIKDYEPDLQQEEVDEFEEKSRGYTIENIR